jgi:hypothetical protein
LPIIKYEPEEPAPRRGGGKIIRSGYRSDADKDDLARFYASAAWKRARRVVLERAGGCCEFCGEEPFVGQPLDVVHLAGSTLELIRGEGDPLDVSRLAAGHRRCHAGYSSGQIPEPRR